MKIEVSNGEILDKLSIVFIKLSKIKDPSKNKNIEKEFLSLMPIGQAIINSSPDNDKIGELYSELIDINKKLWQIEDDIRICERYGDFSEKFIELARSVYFTNDKRAEIKKQINIYTNSGLIEEKGYEDYS